jgi:hypothetical protein
MLGQGVFMMGDGSSYEGNFENGEISGYGTRRWPDGSSYSGQFHLGEFCGQGLYLGANGEQYEGSFEGNRRHGYGKLSCGNGMTYSGEWSQHKFHGQGNLLRADGSQHAGEFAGGLPEGMGTSLSADGRWEIRGQFVKGEPTGVCEVWDHFADLVTELEMNGGPIPVAKPVALRLVVEGSEEEEAEAENPLKLVRSSAGLIGGLIRCLQDTSSSSSSSSSQLFPHSVTGLIVALSVTKAAGEAASGGKGGAPPPKKGAPTVESHAAGGSELRAIPFGTALTKENILATCDYPPLFEVQRRMEGAMVDLKGLDLEAGTYTLHYRDVTPCVEHEALSGGSRNIVVVDEA